MKTKFINKNSQDLIIFLSGWGCDDNQFQNMFNDSLKTDILLCYDYLDLKFEPKADFNKYKNIYLLAYSAGVYIAGLISNKLPKITKSIAINGNPLIFDDYYGISKKAIEAIKNLDLSNYIDFRKNYLVQTDDELEFFNNHSSHRTFESCSKELNSLKQYYLNNTEPYSFDLALLSDSDKIFNPESQKKYFSKKYVLLNNMAHNVFYKFQNFDDIIVFCLKHI